MAKHLYNLDNFSNLDILELFHKATELKKDGINNWGKKYSQLYNKIFVNMFFEPSTRTQFSFEVAASKLGMHVITFNSKVSSINKQETLYDTVKTFEALNCDIACIRHPYVEYYKALADIGISIINGGDGTGRHPTQALLDLYTIYEEFASLKGLKVLIIGDIMHSRVAKTNIMLMESFDMTVKVTGPEEFADPQYNNIADIDSMLDTYDVVMLLRYQHERHAAKFDLNQGVFHKEWGLTRERYDHLKDTAIILHPSPVNRGVEIDSLLVESPKSRILHQTKNGVYIRAALILKLLSE